MATIVVIVSQTVENIVNYFDDEKLLKYILKASKALSCKEVYKMCHTTKEIIKPLSME